MMLQYEHNVYIHFTVKSCHVVVIPHHRADKIIQLHEDDDDKSKYFVKKIVIMI